jgi:hypothetical protein
MPVDEEAISTALDELENREKRQFVAPRLEMACFIILYVIVGMGLNHTL